MKKNKIEIILIASAIVFAILSGFFFYQSKKPKVVDEIPYKEVSSVNYKVHVSDKTYYDAEYLEEGMQYISSIIDYIDIDFKYNAFFDHVKKYSVDKNIIADIIITDNEESDKIIYSKNENLKHEHLTADSLSLDENLKIDYKKYNGLVNDIKTKYGISANAKLIITYKIDYSSDKDNIKNTKISRIEIPLSKQMINISKSDNVNLSDIYITKTIDSIFHKIMKISMLIMSLLSITCFAIVLLKIRDRLKKESPYDRFISSVLKEYDSYITETKKHTNLPHKHVIHIGSFKELLDVRNNIEKTIVYTKIDNNTSKFQIIDDEIYEYVVKREEME